MRRPIALALPIFLIAISFQASMRSQSTEAALKARLKDKQLYLRGCWGGNSLSFDAEGNPIGSPSKISFTLSGFQLKSLELKNDKLILKGKRLGIEFINDKQHLVPIHLDDPKIEIARPVSGDYGTALDAIFADSIASLAPIIPVYWETWVRKNIPGAYVGRPASPIDEPQPGEEDRPTSETTKPMKVGGNVLSPKLTQHVEAEFDPAARNLRYSGKTFIRLVVDADGRPRHIRIEKPLGLGLDEQAVDAVGQYFFKPAAQNGKPVPVEVDIEVNFQIF